MPALVLCRVCRDLRWSNSARPTAVDRISSWPRHPTIDTGISDRHRHHEEGTENHRRRRRGDSEGATNEAYCEGEHQTDRRFHRSTRRTSVPPAGRMWSATTKPRVIASRRQAPMKRGGAGDGMSKNRHPAPTTRPRTRPIVPVIMIFPYSEGEAIAAQTPQTRLAMHPCVRLLTEVVQEMSWLPLRIRLVLIHASISPIGFNR